MAIATRCIPNRSGFGGADWLSTPPTIDNLDDGWWIGALRDHLGGSGSIPHLVFQAVLVTMGGAQFIDLSWNVKMDPGAIPDTGLDAVFVAFESPGPPVATLLVKIALNTSSTVNGAGKPSFASDYFKKVGASAWTAPADPAWIDANTRVWVRPGSGAGTPAKWAVQMRVPMGAEPTGIGVGNPFRMWYQVLTVHDLGAMPHKMPASVATVDVSTDSYPAGSAGTLYTLNTPAGGYSCGENVTLAYADVGTTNTDAAGNPAPHLIKTSPADNHFLIKPRNETSAAINAGRIDASIRVKNWGAASLLGSWRTITPDSVVPHSSIAPMTKGTIDIEWTPTASESSLYLSEPNQCIVVELRDTSGGGLNFIPRQVMRNMQFVTASTYHKSAEIDIAGITAMRTVEPAPNSLLQWLERIFGRVPRGVATRDVYLYVEQLQMPQDYRKWLREGGWGEEIPGIVREFSRQESPLFRMFDLVRWAENSDIAWEQIAAYIPTYRVHAYYDTGERFIRDGTVYPYLESLATFGYYVDHEGDIQGWVTRLYGATKIAPDWYFLQIPEEGRATVTTVIRAIEPGVEEKTLPEERFGERPRYTMPRRRDGDSNQPPGCLGLLLAVLNGVVKALRGSSTK